jgi:hypothetical protein
MPHSLEAASTNHRSRRALVAAALTITASAFHPSLAQSQSEILREKIAEHAQEKAPTYQARFLAERRELERSLEQTGTARADGVVLNALANLCRSYLGAGKTA